VNDKSSKSVYNVAKKECIVGYKLEMLQMFFKRPSTDFKKYIGKEIVNSRSTKYAQIDNATPTVVFENGMNAGMKFWDEVFLEIGKTHTVFAYNRNDKKDTENKRVSTNRVEHLRELLLKRGLKPPYVLVGHSLGGTYVQYFTKKYPSEVVGVVVVDTPCPGAMEDVSVFPKVLIRLYSNIFKEIHQIDQKILALPTTNTEMSILVATQKRFTSQYKEYIPMTNLIHEKAKEYSTLYPQCTIQWIDTGHVVMFEKPELVSETIKELLARIENKDT